MAKWTEERRRKQAEAIKRWKPWEKSTGPKTKAGKSRASMNAYKYGGDTALWRDVGEMCRLNRDFLKVCYKIALAQLAQNELLKAKQNQRGYTPPPDERGKTN